MHAHCVFRGLDVTISEHGNLERVHDGSDLLPARAPRVHLRASAGVQRKRARSSILASERDRDRVAHVLAPAASDLARNGEMRARGDGAENRLHEIEIAQAAGSTVSLDDFLDRTAEVDVDELGLKDVGYE